MRLGFSIIDPLGAAGAAVRLWLFAGFYYSLNTITYRHGGIRSFYTVFSNDVLPRSSRGPDERGLERGRDHAPMRPRRYVSKTANGRYVRILSLLATARSTKVQGRTETDRRKSGHIAVRVHMKQLSSSSGLPLLGSGAARAATTCTRTAVKRHTWGRQGSEQGGCPWGGCLCSAASFSASDSPLVGRGLARAPRPGTCLPRSHSSPS